VTTTELAIHAYALHRGPIWRSDACAAPDHHLHIEAPAMTGIDYRIGDTRDVTATIPTGSVSLVATSPPFLALRSYLPADHPDKHAEIGSEPDPATFIDTLLGLTAEWGRVLAPWGSIAIELGDTYTGAGGYGNPDSLNPAYGGPKTEGHFEGRTAKRFKKVDDGWPMAKSLALIPQAYALSLAYGRNVLNGNPSPAGQWRVRNVIVWQRPNPAVGALGDKFRPSTSYIVVATRDAKRWFDLTAVRGEGSSNTHARTRKGVDVQPTTGKTADKDGNFHTLNTQHLTENGAPPLDCWFDEWDGSHDTWTITTQPSKIAHYAMWPAKLAERLVLSMCPAEVCSACGEPRRRIDSYSLDSFRQSTRPQTVRAVALADAHDLTDEHIAAIRAVGISGDGKARKVNTGAGKNRPEVQALYDEAKVVLRGYVREFCTNTEARPISHWTDCGCGAPWTAGTVLDPFCGSATTMCVAELHNRDAIGIDIDPRNRELMPRRMEEVRRNLFGTKPELPGQIDLFADGAA